MERNLINTYGENLVADLISAMNSLGLILVRKNYITMLKERAAELEEELRRVDPNNQLLEEKIVDAE